MILKNFDFISPPITLFYHGMESHSSIYTGIISLIVLIICIISAIILSLDIFLKRNPSIFYWKKSIEDVEKTYLNEDNFLHFITLLDENLNNIYDERAFTIIGINNFTTNMIINTTTTKESKKNRTNTLYNNFSYYIYDICDEKKDGGEIITEIDKKNSFLRSLCIKAYYNKTSNTTIYKGDKNFEYPFLQHGYSRGNNINYGILIRKCVNGSTLNNVTCYDSTILDDLKNELYYYSITFIDDSLNPDNYSFPFSNSLNNVTYKYEEEEFTINYLFFHNIELETTTGFLFDFVNNKQTIAYDYSTYTTLSIEENENKSSENDDEKEEEDEDKNKKEDEDMNKNDDGDHHENEKEDEEKKRKFNEDEDDDEEDDDDDDDDYDEEDEEDRLRLRRNLVENTTTITNTTELTGTFQYINMFALNMRNYNEVYQRQYKKIQDVIGTIDGFLAIFLFICEIVHNFLYHDFLTIHDFNNILYVKVNNNKINQNHIENSKNDIKNNIIKKNSEIDSIKNNISIFSKENSFAPSDNEEFNIRNLKSNNNIIIKKDSINEKKNYETIKYPISKFEKKLTKNYQNIFWNQYIKNNFGFAFKKWKNKYFESIKKFREELLSEEGIFINYSQMKLINENLLFDLYLNSNNINHNLTENKNFDKINNNFNSKENSINEKYNNENKNKKENKIKKNTQTIELLENENKNENDNSQIENKNNINENNNINININENNINNNKI